MEWISYWSIYLFAGWIKASAIHYIRKPPRAATHSPVWPFRRQYITGSRVFWYFFVALIRAPRPRKSLTILIWRFHVARCNKVPIEVTMRSWPGSRYSTYLPFPRSWPLWPIHRGSILILTHGFHQCSSGRPEIFLFQSTRYLLK